MDDFFSAYWERAPLSIRRNQPGRFAGLMSLSSFDRLVAASNLRYPFVRLFQDGKLLPLEQFLTSRQVGPNVERDLANVGALYEACADGATLVLQAAEKYCAPLGVLCAGFETFFGAPVQAYAYHTPPDGRGPPAHYDTHEVIVLQVEGRKVWRVWRATQPFPMRMAEDRYDADAVRLLSDSTQPLCEVELSPGDTLYIPRGFVHAARTSAERSLHVSLSIMVWRYADLLRSAVEDTLARLRDDPRLQCSLPFGRQPGSPVSPDLEDRWLALKSSFVQDLSTQEAAARARALIEVELDRDRVRLRTGQLSRRLRNWADQTHG